MKLSLLLAIGLFSASIAYSQEALESAKQHQLGVNATAFISNFLSFNSSSPSMTPLSFMYKHGDDQGAYRLLIGIGGNSQTSDQDGSDFSEVQKNFETFIRSGKEWRFWVGDRWRPYVGVDGFASFERDIFETHSSFDDFKSTNQNISLGVGGLLGIQFQINDRIFLTTESYLDLFASYSLEKFEGQFSDQKTTTSGYGFSASLPTNIYFVVQF